MQALNTDCASFMKRVNWNLGARESLTRSLLEGIEWKSRKGREEGKLNCLLPSSFIQLSICWALQKGQLPKTLDATVLLELATAELKCSKFLSLFGIMRNCQRSGRNVLLYVFIRMVIKPTVIIIEDLHCYQYATRRKFQTFFCQG
jgi:hypothetical protein